MAQNLIPIGNLTCFPTKEDCTHTPCYCEENIWLLIKKVHDTTPEKLVHCFTVFISNEIKRIPLWQQSASKENDGFIAWDYHVIMVYCGKDKSLVFDFSSQLQFPTEFTSYCEETFKPHILLRPSFHRFFRIIPAGLYLKYFSSDRSHMKREDGSWLKPPPNYPCINNGKDTHNLFNYISMKEDAAQSDKYGTVFNLSSFISKFSTINGSQTNYLHPMHLQPS